jgi:2-(1,2-epoxy-1,2-dihydrophenyl)acetyl-CoA isomerase
MAYTTITLDVSNGVARLTLDRPQARNGIERELARDLAAAALALHEDTSVRAVLIRGSGPVFCAGGDLKIFAAQGDGLGAYIKEVTVDLHTAVIHLTQLDAPVIAAVHGSAAGAGLGLVAGADLVLAAESARFVMAYTMVGLVPDGGSTWFLPRKVGLGRALDMSLLNRPLSAAEAMAAGLVTRVVADDRLEEEAEAMAVAIAAGPTRSFGATKRLLRASFGNGLETQLELESRGISDAGRTHDGREGIAAFLDKRTPHFQAR